MAIYVIIAIVAVAVTLLIAVPVTANISVKKKAGKGCRDHRNCGSEGKKHYR